MLTLSLLLAVAPTVETTPPTLPSSDVEDIVVRARPRGEAPPPPPDPVAYLRRFCFDPMRRTGVPAPPLDDPEWEALGPADRARLGLTDPQAPAFAMFDAAWEMTLVIRFETFGKASMPERRCTLVAIGGPDHKALVDRMSALFRAPGTQSHVGHPAGAPKLDGWDQHLWTAMPSRGSPAWAGSNARRTEAGTGWVGVIDSAFYDRYDHVVGDLKIREKGDRPLSIVTLALTSRDGPAERTRRR